MMHKVFLDPEIRATADKKSGEYAFHKSTPKKALSPKASETKAMLESLTQASAAEGSKVGVDVEDIRAINMENETFLERNFTENERAYCTKAPSPQASYAGRWSAKEAVFKSLGVCSKGAGAPLQDIEIVSDENGAPKVVLHGAALQAAKEAGVKNVNVSISHSDSQAIAVAVSAF